MKKLDVTAAGGGRRKDCKKGGTFLLLQKPRQLESRFLESVWDLEADVFSEIWGKKGGIISMSGNGK